MIDEPDTDEALRVSNEFLGSVEALRAGDRVRAADLLAGPPQDDYGCARRLYGMFAVAAVITGCLVRKVCADPSDPSPMDGFVALEIADVASGLPTHPDDLPLTDKLTIWALTAGANLDADAIGAHLRNLYRRGGDKALCEGLLLLATISAAAWDDEALQA